MPGSIPVVGGCDAGARTNTTEALSLHTIYFAVGPMMLTARFRCAALGPPRDHSPRRALVVGGDSETSNLATTHTEVPMAAT